MALSSHSAPRPSCPSSDEVASLPLSELWRQLARRGMKTVGSKAEVMERLRAALRKEEEKTQRRAAREAFGRATASSSPFPAFPVRSSVGIIDVCDGVLGARVPRKRRREKVDASADSELGLIRDAPHAPALPSGWTVLDNASDAVSVDHDEAARGWDAAALEGASYVLMSCCPTDQAPQVAGGDSGLDGVLLHPSGQYVWGGPCPIPGYVCTALGEEA